MDVRVSVTGRLCLFGEHSDWAAEHRDAMTDGADRPPGLCLVAGTDQGLEAEVEALEGFVELSSRLADGSTTPTLRVPARVEDLDRACRTGGFFRYALGAAAETLARHRVGGMRLHVDVVDLPMGKGLSSSAAVAVLVARALDRIHALGLDREEEMEIAYRGERRSGSLCGRMDPVCAFGRVPTFLRFEDGGLVVEALRVAAPLHLLIVDLGRHKDTVRILDDLNACFPDRRDAVARAVRSALGPANAELVTRARASLEAGDAPALGALMVEAQARFDRDVAPASAALTAPALRELLAHPAIAELGWGGKGVGSQGDGSAQIVARGAAEREALARILSTERGLRCLPLTIEAEGAALRNA